MSLMYKIIGSLCILTIVLAPVGIIILILDDMLVELKKQNTKEVEK